MKSALHRSVESIGNKGSYLFAVVVVITAYEVVMRYVFASPTTWVHELSVALSAVAFAFGGPYAMEQDAHLRISAVRDRAGPGLRAACTALSALCGTLYLGALAYAFTIRAYETGWRFEDGHWAPETTGRTWDIPIPPFMHATIAICCVVFVLLLYVRRGVDPNQK